MSLKLNEQLAETLKKAEAIAVEIDRAGGNVQGVIHHIRGAATQTKLRVQAYQEDLKAKAAEAAQAEEEANAKAEAEAQAKLNADAKAKADAEAKAKAEADAKDSATKA